MLKTPNENGFFELKIFILISLFLKCFLLAHCNPLSSDCGEDSILNNIPRFFFFGRERIIGLNVKPGLKEVKGKHTI